MSTPSLKLRGLLDDFAQRDGLPPDAARHMQDAISSSPYLTDFLSLAAEKGVVKHIRLSPSDTSSAGYYDELEKTIYINSRDFEDIRKEKLSVLQLQDRIVSTVGHETSHAFGADRYRDSTTQLDRDIYFGLQEAGTGERVDLTEPVKEFLDFARLSEARAERAGFNALASRVVAQNGGKLDANDLLERGAGSTYCVIGKELAPGITFDSQGHITRTQTEAVARCHFDRPTGSLSRDPGSNTNYRNYYGAYAIEVIEVRAREARARGAEPEILLGMKRLQLDREQIENAGLDFRREGRELYVADPDGGFLKFTHNASNPARAAPDEHVPLKRLDGSDVVTRGFSDPTHRDHALYQTVRNSVQTLLPPGAEVSDDRLAQFTLAAKAAHFKPDGRIDALVSETGVSFHGDYPAHSTRVDLADPVPSADESAGKAADMGREQARQSEQLASRPPPQQEHAPVMEH